MYTAGGHQFHRFGHAGASQCLIGSITVVGRENESLPFGKMLALRCTALCLLWSNMEAVEVLRFKDKLLEEASSE
jgi:hypothetical protein